MAAATAGIWEGTLLSHSTLSAADGDSAAKEMRSHRAHVEGEAVFVRKSHKTCRSDAAQL